jgi:hypothetical protein
LNDAPHSIQFNSTVFRAHSTQFKLNLITFKWYLNYKSHEDTKLIIFKILIIVIKIIIIKLELFYFIKDININY